MAQNGKKKTFNKYKKQEMKIVLGGFLTILILTLVLGTVIVSMKGRNEKPDTSEVYSTTKNVTEVSSTQLKDENEPTSEEESEKKEDEELSEEDAEHEDGEEKETKADDGSFDPKEVSVDGDNWQLILLNTENRLADDYKPELAAAIPGSNQYLDKRVQPFYEKMYNAAKEEGVILTPFSGYRSIENQKRIYLHKVEIFESQGYSKEEAEKKAARSAMPPGCSENNFGIAMDIGSANEGFNQTEAYAWLKKNAEKYGFIERYPENKTEITGVDPQPWHWRFVGAENAKQMNSKGLCLEEYLG